MFFALCSSRVSPSNLKLATSTQSSLITSFTYFLFRELITDALFQGCTCILYWNCFHTYNDLDYLVDRVPFISIRCKFGKNTANSSHSGKFRQRPLGLLLQFYRMTSAKNLLISIIRLMKRISGRGGPLLFC